mmetsp:Transcript_66973/g.205104  ORF Transcript_66973/g.205104 Transcript_66973/m.205104 type:complete len:206 (-) Transcript_66973:1238-1855(-)
MVHGPHQATLGKQAGAQVHNEALHLGQEGIEIAVPHHGRFGMRAVPRAVVMRFNPMDNDDVEQVLLRAAHQLPAEVRPALVVAARKQLALVEVRARRHFQSHVQGRHRHHRRNHQYRRRGAEQVRHPKPNDVFFQQPRRIRLRCLPPPKALDAAEEAVLQDEHGWQEQHRNYEVHKHHQSREQSEKPQWWDDRNSIAKERDSRSE